MTDLKIHKRNAITGDRLYMNIKNIEGFPSEIRQTIEDLIDAYDYPKQSRIDDYNKDRRKWE